MNWIVTTCDEEDRDAWDRFIATAPDGGFLHSWQWGEILRAEGRLISRLVIKNEDICAACLVVLSELPGGFVYALSPRGPVAGVSAPTDFMEGFAAKIREIYSKQRLVFWRCEPLQSGTGFLVDKRLRGVDTHSPAETLLLDLSESTSSILAAMHPKTRYNIKLAEKKGIIVRTGGMDDLPVFFKLLQETAARDQIRIFPYHHYETIFAKLSETQSVRLYIAELPQEDNTAISLAGILVMHFGRFAVYLHGASGNQYRNLMAPYLLQWTAICHAKDQGLAHYDFYGVSATNPKWQGITRFKKGFAPDNAFTTFPGTFEWVFDHPVYSLLRSLKIVRKFASVLRSQRRPGRTAVNE